MLQSTRRITPPILFDSHDASTTVSLGATAYKWTFLYQELMSVSESAGSSDSDCFCIDGIPLDPLFLLAS